MMHCALFITQTLTDNSVTLSKPSLTHSSLLTSPIHGNTMHVSVCVSIHKPYIHSLYPTYHIVLCVEADIYVQRIVYNTQRVCIIYIYPIRSIRSPGRGVVSLLLCNNAGTGGNVPICTRERYCPFTVALCVSVRRGGGVCSKTKRRRT